MIIEGVLLSPTDKSSDAKSNTFNGNPSLSRTTRLDKREITNKIEFCVDVIGNAAIQIHDPYFLLVYVFTVVPVTNLQIKFMYISKTYCIIFVKYLEGISKIIKTWKAGHNSINLCLLVSFTRQFALDEPSYVIVEKKPELHGILIRKLELGDRK